MPNGSEHNGQIRSDIWLKIQALEREIRTLQQESLELQDSTNVLHLNIRRLWQEVEDLKGKMNNLRTLLEKSLEKLREVLEKILLKEGDGQPTEKKSWSS